MSERLIQDTFEIELPPGFTVHDDGDGLQAVSTNPPGVICFTAEVVENPDDLPNLSRMLAAFLTRNGHPVATDELLKITAVSNAHGFSWQYVEDNNYHRFWLFGNHASWLLVTFVCPEQHRIEQHEPMQKIFHSLRLIDAPAA